MKVFAPKYERSLGLNDSIEPKKAGCQIIHYFTLCINLSLKYDLQARTQASPPPLHKREREREREYVNQEWTARSGENSFNVSFFHIFHIDIRVITSQIPNSKELPRDSPIGLCPGPAGDLDSPKPLENTGRSSKIKFWIRVCSYPPPPNIMCTCVLINTHIYKITINLKPKMFSKQWIIEFTLIIQ